MTNIIIRYVDSFEADEIIEAIGAEFGLLADEIEDGDIV